MADELDKDKDKTQASSEDADTRSEAPQEPDGNAEEHHDLGIAGMS